MVRNLSKIPILYQNVLSMIDPSFWKHQSYSIQNVGRDPIFYPSFYHSLITVTGSHCLLSTPGYYPKFILWYAIFWKGRNLIGRLWKKTHGRTIGRRPETSTHNYTVELYFGVDGMTV